MNISFLNLFKIYKNPNILAIFLLGSSAGMSLGLILQALFIWLSLANIDKAIIGSLTLMQAPYIAKFLWAPFIDSIKIPFLYKLGKRTSWLIVIQIFIIIATERLGASNPIENITATFFWSGILATAVASMNIVLDAYRIEILKKEEQGAGVTALITGYRTGGLIIGSALLIFIDYIHKNNLCSTQFCNWYYGYLIIAIVSSCNIIIILMTKEWKNKNIQQYVNLTLSKNDSFKEKFKYIVIEPFKDLISRKNCIIFFAFIFTYKLCDSFIFAMLSPFLIETGFTLTQLGLVVKTFGFFATLVGSIIGGIMVEKIGVMKGLLISAILQALSNLVFILQDIYGANITLLYLSIGAENITGSMAITVIVVYMSSICNKSFTATQYSLITSLATMSNIIIGPLSGELVNYVGWKSFFFISFLCGLPAIIMYIFFHKKLKDSIIHFN